ncbi:MAG: hypothetical protein U0795_22630 [Pirellulales bacterium]
MDDRNLMQSLKSAYPDDGLTAAQYWTELANRSQRLAERAAVVRRHRRVAVAAAGVASCFVLAAFLSIGGLTHWSSQRGDQIAVQQPIPAEYEATKAMLAELQRQADVQLAVIKFTSARERTARLQRELATLSDDDSALDSMLAEARAASWLLADADRRAKRDEAHERTEARRLYEQLMRVYPGTPAAERASARLAQHSPGAH